MSRNKELYVDASSTPLNKLSRAHPSTSRNYTLVYIEKLHTGVTSDVNGFYTFSNLDPGTYTVKVSYVGYSPVELKITIPAGRTLEKDVVLNEGVELQEVVVGGAFQGQRRAINSQKNNMGITNVVSADQVGKFPDSNIGDALKRISGINVQYDQGDPCLPLRRPLLQRQTRLDCIGLLSELTFWFLRHRICMGAG